MMDRAVFETDIPARLDRLPWTRFHWLVVTALGVTWILDGLEVTLVGSLSGALKESSMLLSDAQIGYSASCYLIGAVVGALGFGWLTDRVGRKAMFTATVLTYLLATIASGFAWDFWSFALFRMIAGAGIGGEYSAVNATIQELIPARRRGFTDLVINGSFWIGAALGAGGALVVLDPVLMDQAYGWRAAFLIGGVIGFLALLVRRWIPESPRWLMTHGRLDAAEAVMAGIERTVSSTSGPLPPIPPNRKIRLHQDTGEWFWEGVKSLFTQYRRRTVVGVALMTAQAFCYNAIFFTYALILTKFYDIPSGRIGLFILPFAVGNFAGPLVLGPLFDSLGRKTMIAGTYILSGVLLIITGWLFSIGILDAVQQTAAWTVIFFFASAAASSAYLTVGEVFPLEVRAVAIAIFYAFGTGLGGVSGPAIFGRLIESGSREAIFYGYLLGGALMIGGGLVQAVLGIDCQRRSLEDVAPPLCQAGAAVAPRAPMPARAREASQMPR
jgi:MFS family permease